MEAYLPACLLGRKVVRAFVQRKTLFTSSSVHRTGAQPAEGGDLAASLNRSCGGLTRLHLQVGRLLVKRVNGELVCDPNECNAESILRVCGAVGVLST